MDSQSVPTDSTALAASETRKEERPETNLKSPTLAFLVVCLGVLVVETLLMWLLTPLFHFSEGLESLVDATILLIVMAPLLYFMFVQPMARVIHEKTQAERALRVVCEDLEARVKARTADLEFTNASLQEQINQKGRVMARLQIQGRLLDAVQQAVLSTGTDGTITYWNRFAEEMFGWSKDEATGRILSDLCLFPEAILPPYLSDPFTARAWDGEVPATRRDGFRFPAYLSCSPMWKPNCTIGGLVYTFLDISDRKEAEETIRYSEEKYSTLVENSPTGIFVLQNEQVVFANRRFFEMMNWPPEDLGALHPAEIVHPEDWPLLQEVWQKRFAGEEPVQDNEYRFLTPGGGIRWLSGRSTLIHVHGQKALLGNVQDVTERHETALALQDSQEMLQRLSASLLTAQEGERKRVARELHDSLGQSLSAIKFIVERALESSSPHENAGFQTTIRSVVPVIQSTMEEVRRISMALRPSTLDDLGLLMTLSWFTREFQTTYPDIRIETILEVKEDQIPETLKTDIFRIVQEAMNNAAKYSQTELIRLSLKQIEDSLELRIQDEGIGFDPSQEKKADHHGGLGLNSMRERAILFGGSCTIISAPGAGTTVAARWTVEESLPAKQT